MEMWAGPSAQVLGGILEWEPRCQVWSSQLRLIAKDTHLVICGMRQADQSAQVQWVQGKQSPAESQLGVGLQGSD